MARGFGAAESRFSIKDRVRSDARALSKDPEAANIRESVLKSLDGIDKASAGNKSKPMGELVRTIQSLVNVPEDWAKMYDGEQHDESVNKINEMLADPEKKAAFLKENGEIGDGKIGNGIKQKDGSVMLRVEDIAWMCQNFRVSEEFSDEAMSEVKYTDDSSTGSTDVALVLRGLDRNGKFGAGVKMDAEYTVSSGETLYGDQNTGTGGVDFSLYVGSKPNDIKTLQGIFRDNGFKVGASEMKILANYLSKASETETEWDYKDHPDNYRDYGRDDY